MSNTLILKPINDLLSEKFFVPSYQRGYRWTSDEVIALLDDIWEFDNTTNSFYCLQPVVVQKKDNGVWELIDGQQRLTTVLLILLYLNENEFKKPKNTYEINYQTRGSSNDFVIKIINSSSNAENVDFFYLKNAYLKIEKWLEDKSKEISSINSDFYSKLINHTKVIWYQVNSDDTKLTDIFTRINIGKIPLTNAELVKALFLNKDNKYYKGQNENNIKQLQLQIATEWDNIEKALQKNAFWSFLYNGSKNYDTRIEYIFDLIQGKDNQKHEKNFTFNKYTEALKIEPNIEKHWNNIKNHFLLFDEWYSDDELFHLIGFLVTVGTKIIDIKNEAEKRTKLDFKKYLIGEIQEKMNFEIDELRYDRQSDKDKIRMTLLLFNIATLIANDANIRFSFEKYKDKDKTWDIEHIRSQTDNYPNSEDRRTQWRKDNLAFFLGIDVENINDIDLTEYEDDLNYTLIEKIYKFDENVNYSSQSFEILFKEIQSLFKEDSTIDTHHISNLALLNTDINRSYQNAFFPIKRKIILEKGSKGIFIPLCTKNVFLKSYSKKLSDVMYWQKKDADDYFDAIKTVLHKYQKHR